MILFLPIYWPTLSSISSFLHNSLKLSNIYSSLYQPVSHISSISTSNPHNLNHSVYHPYPHQYQYQYHLIMIMIMITTTFSASSF